MGGNAFNCDFVADNAPCTGFHMVLCREITVVMQMLSQAGSGLHLRHLCVYLLPFPIAWIPPWGAEHQGSMFSVGLARALLGKQRCGAMHEGSSSVHSTGLHFFSQGKLTLCVVFKAKHSHWRLIFAVHLSGLLCFVAKDENSCVGLSWHELPLQHFHVRE